MIKKTTIKLDIEINEDNTSIKEVKYKDYSKNTDNEEDLLTYKSVIKYDSDGKKCYNSETFNKLKISEDIVDEIIGNSSNKEDWKILEYKNHNLEKDYTKLYDNIKLDVNYDIINKIEDKKYLVHK